MMSGNKTIHNLTDIQSFYDRQLAGFGSIIEELLRWDRKAIQLFTKLLPVFEHHLCTAYEICNQYYRGSNNKHVGTGQGNHFSGDICQDKLRLIIRVPEKQELGIKIQSPITSTQLQELYIGFVNDIDFNTDEEEAQVKI